MEAEIAIRQDDAKVLARYLRQPDPAPGIIATIARLLDPDFVNANENRRQLKFARRKEAQALVFGRSKAGNGSVALRLDIERSAMCVRVAKLIADGEYGGSLKRIYDKVAGEFGAKEHTVRNAWRMHQKACQR